MRLILTILLTLAGVVSYAQDSSCPEAISLEGMTGLMKNSYLSVDWVNPQAFTYYVETETGKDYYIVDAKTWKPRQMFETSEFIAKLNEHLAKKVEASDFRLPNTLFDKDNLDVFTFSYRNVHYKYNIATKELTTTEPPQKKPFKKQSKSWYRSYSKDSLYYVSTKGHDLWMYDVQKGDSLRLTEDGERWNSYSLSGKSEVPADKPGSCIGRWVGKSHKRLMIREDWRSVETLTIVNSLAEPRPRAETYKFAMPGDTGVVRYNIMLADADNGQIYRIDMDRFDDQFIKLPVMKNFPCTDRYAYLIRVSRTRDTLDLCRIDVTDRSVKTLISEVCAPHFNEQLFSYHVINNGKEILWWSDRSGKGRWYLYDGEGNLKNALTTEDFTSGNIIKIDTTDRKVIFEGYGKEAGINPHYRFYYEARFDGKVPAKLLTPGNGNHEIKFAPGGKYMEDTWSRMDMAPKRQIVDRKGKVRFELPATDVSALEAKGWRYPEVISLKAADGQTDLWGVVYTPLNMEPGKKYPIISSVYPGPQDDQVPQSFYFDENDNQSLAERGFVVINFAYRGSGPFRGKDFHTYGYGNLRDYPLDDDYAVIRQIAEKYPYADSTKVGIYGHSGGGFMTVAAMLGKPDFYKVGVAASGNHDNNIYMQMWGETFHGVKNTGSGFTCKVPTNIEKAANLKGKLLLITGDIDDNVHPAGTYRLVNALIKNNKKFDMMVFPGKDHAMGGSYYVNLIHDYFTDHLK